LQLLLKRVDLDLLLCDLSLQIGNLAVQARCGGLIRADLRGQRIHLRLLDGDVSLQLRKQLRWNSRDRLELANDCGDIGNDRKRDAIGK